MRWPATDIASCDAMSVTLENRIYAVPGQQPGYLKINFQSQLSDAETAVSA